MDVVHERAAGIDISKRDAKVCVRIPSGTPGEFTTTVTTYGSTTAEVLRLRADLESVGVSIVVMEATGDYWKPFFFVLEEALPVELVNAKQAKNIPGRKTDVSDAVWLAQLAAHGLLRGSFIPPEPIRELRDLTRARETVTHERTREYNRLEKVLEGTGIKLTSIASSITTKYVRRVLDALAAGQSDPRVLASLVTASMRKDSTNLIDALTGRVTEHHRFLVTLHLGRIDQLTNTIDLLNERIDQVMDPFRMAREALTTIPGISARGAEAIIAEIGVDMGRFPTPKHLASWAGVCPSHNESAGRVKSTHIQPGNHHLKAILGIAAMSASRSRTSYLAVKYRRIQARRGSMKAVVAIEHTILVAIWHMLTNGEAFTDPGHDYHTTTHLDQSKNTALRTLHQLGYQVELTPATAA